MLEINRGVYIEVNRIEAINLIMIDPARDNWSCAWDIQVNGHIYRTHSFDDRATANKWLKENNLL